MNIISLLANKNHVLVGLILPYLSTSNNLSAPFATN